MTKWDWTDWRTLENWLITLVLAHAPNLRAAAAVLGLDPETVSGRAEDLGLRWRRQRKGGQLKPPPPALTEALLGIGLPAAELAAQPWPTVRTLRRLYQAAVLAHAPGYEAAAAALGCKGDTLSRCARKHGLPEPPGRSGPMRPPPENWVALLRLVHPPPDAAAGAALPPATITTSVAYARQSPPDPLHCTRWVIHARLADPTGNSNPKQGQ